MPTACRSLGTLLALALLSGPIAHAADTAAGHEFFENKIRPVLVEHCFACHSQDAAKNKKLRGGLFLDSRAGLRQGGDSGSILEPGKPDASLLLQSLTHQGEVRMPPKGKLSDAVLADFRRWVEMGAPDPRDGKTASQKETDLERGQKLWSLQPPRAGEPPQITAAGTAIDRFLLAALKEKGIPIAPAAEPVTLVRRLYFDLIGLPPTPEQVNAYLADASRDRQKATEKLVDELLASPHHGERWGRHWLDVARYAEDQAHTFGVKPRANAWRYRDWVIRAFNQDMPYDRFVRLQLAGDLVQNDALSAADRIAGLGFLGLGAEYYKNSAKEQAIADELDDRVDTVTRGFLGLTVSCSRCHDHKFDPIPQKDYYSIAGVFNGSSFGEAPLASPAEVKTYNDAQARIKEQDGRITALLNGVGQGPSRSAVAETAKYLVAGWRIWVLKQHKVAANVAAIARAEGLHPYFLDRWVKAVENAGKTPLLAKDWPGTKRPAKKPANFADVAVPAEVRKYADDLATRTKTALEKNKNNDPLLKAVRLDGSAPCFVAPQDAEKHFLGEPEKKQLGELRAELERRKQAAPPMYAFAHVLKGGGREMKVFVRGNPLQPGEPAPKGFLQVIRPTLGDLPVSADYNRLDLANAIVSPKNPLTARIIVNRVWAWHFGRGLVTTPSNFGELGSRPSHPELLDWLAVKFMEQGWSLKWLHRQIVLTAAYQRSSNADAESLKVDPENVYLGRGTRQRLEIEIYRDALLAVAGRLDVTLGGPTFNLKDANATRRTVYAKISRHDLDGLLRLFDFPDANVTADKRVSTTVPQQQLFVLNSDFIQTQAKAFAERVQKEAATDPERIDRAYRLAFGREPTDAEHSLGLAFLGRPQAPNTPPRWQQYAQALLATNEFLYID